jgi:hypothetical protein
MRGCRPLRPEEVVAVTQSFGGRDQWRDRALFLVGLYTGFCITDLLGLRWHDCLRYGQVAASLTVARRHIKHKQHVRTVTLHPAPPPPWRAGTKMRSPPRIPSMSFALEKGSTGR